MSTTGEIFPTAVETVSESPWSDNDWNTASGVTADGGDTANIVSPTFDNNDQSYVLKAYTFDLSAIPAGATVDGVICRVNAWYRSGEGSASIDLMQLLDTSRAKGGTNQCSTPEALTTTDTTVITKGGSTDTWGLSLTDTWVKNSNFGVAIGVIATDNNSDVDIDYITLEVYYTYSGPLEPSVAQGSDVGETVALDVPLPAAPVESIGLSDASNVLYPAFITLSDVVTVELSEGPAADLEASSSDGIDIEDAAAVLKDIVPSVFEGVEVGESADALKDIVPSVFDGVEIGESVSAVKDIEPSVYDGVEVGESVDLLKDLVPSPVEGINVGETVGASLGEISDITTDVHQGIDVSDVSSLLKDIVPGPVDGIEIEDSPSITIEIGLSVAQGVGASENLSLLKDIVPSVYEGVDVGESTPVGIEGGDINISVYEGLVLSAVSNVLYPLVIVIGETITIDWITYPGFLYNYERIGVIESVDVFSSGLGIDVHENIVIEESNYYVPFIYEAIGVTDIRTVFLDWLNVEVYDGLAVHDASFPPGDQIAVSEYVAVALDLSTINYVSVHEGVGVDDVPEPVTLLLSPEGVEAVGVTENLAIILELAEIDVHDGIGTAASAAAGIIEAAYLQVLAQENAVMGETVGPAENLADILRYETVGLRDLVTVIRNLYAAVSDSVGIDEYMAVVMDVVGPLLIPNMSEAVAMSEAIEILEDILPSLIEEVGVSDAAILAQDIKVSAYDIVAAVEHVAALFATNLSVTQQVAIREYLDLYIETRVSAAQNILLREVHFVELEIPGLVGIDNSAVREYIAVRTEQAQGRASFTFEYKKPMISMTHKKPDVTFTHKKPYVAFAGE